MAYETLIVAFVCYACVGIVIAAAGPVRRLLDKAVADLRKARAADDDSKTRAAPSSKVLPS